MVVNIGDIDRLRLITLASPFVAIVAITVVLPLPLLARAYKKKMTTG